MPPPFALRPAHETKHIPYLDYPFRNYVFHLAQLDNGATNGTGLWLGAQCLSLYLSDTLKYKSPSSPTSPSSRARPRAIELGSGIGLSALALASMGWDVVATDLEDVINPVLAPNIARNRGSLPPAAGRIDVRVLDWTLLPDQWAWNDPNKIASTLCTEDQSLHDPQQTILAPPFDLIISSDTLYSVELVTPLLRTLHSLCKCSIESSPDTRPPPVYLCLERRDPSLIDRALSEARDNWDFKLERVPPKRLAKAMEKGGARWEKDQWDGVELWKMILRT